MKREKSSIFYFFMTTMVLFCVMGSLLLYSNQKEVQNKKEEALRETKIYAERIESLLRDLFHKTDILESIIITSKGVVPEETFYDLAQSVSDGAGIRAIQYLPKGTVQYCYPLEGNEESLGDNVFLNPARKQDALLAAETKEITISGPYRLLQGGFGLVARNPIFLTDEAGMEEFWGFSVIILDLPEALEPIHLMELRKSNYEYILHCVTEQGEEVVIDQSPHITWKGAVNSTLEVPGRKWTLTLNARNGWLNFNKIAIQMLSSLILSLLCGILVYQNKEKQKKIHIMAVTDELTGTANRRAIQQDLKERCKQEQEPFLFLYMDLDGFKKVNDCLGHAYGDALLIEVAKRLQEFLKWQDALSRIGGDEFIMILQQKEEPYEIESLVKKIRQEIERPYSLNGKQAHISISIGAVKFPEDAKEADPITVLADKRMYADKQKRKRACKKGVERADS